jgi:hypothetical protein
MTDSTHDNGAYVTLEREVHELVEALDLLQRQREPFDVEGIAEKLNVLTLLVVRLAHYQLKDGAFQIDSVEFPNAR